jgi:hypothetical protein
MLNVDTNLPLKQWHIRPSLSMINISVDVPWDYDMVNATVILAKF